MQTQVTIDPARRAKVAELGLKHGAHRDIESGMCAMEAASYIAGEPWSDHPQCVSPVIAAFMRSWNDALSDEDRNHLITPELIAKTIGTASPALDERRAYMAVDWYIRVHTPAWLRLAGLTQQADTIATLPEITRFAQIPPIRGPLEAVRKDAAAAWDAAWDAARAAAGAPAWDAAWAAAWDAAGAPALAAAWAAAWDAAGAPALAAALAAAWDAAWDAARAAALAPALAPAWAAARDAAGAPALAPAWAALKPTVAELQKSALDLVERMCALAEAA